jgi:PAS domain S-box-containing protein
MTRGRKLIRELEETESRFATLFELLPDPVVVHQDGRLIYVNRAGVRMYGATYGCATSANVRSRWKVIESSPPGRTRR